MLPSGQWKIEIILESNEEDTSIIQVNGIDLKITAIGNPPAMVLSDEGNLLLPNKEYYTIPTNGGLGKELFIIIGAGIIFTGFMILIFNKIKNKKERKKEK